MYSEEKTTTVKSKVSSDKVKKGDISNTENADKPPEHVEEEPPIPRKTECMCCLTYERASLVIAVVDFVALAIVIAMIFVLKNATATI